MLNQYLDASKGPCRVLHAGRRVASTARKAYSPIECLLLTILLMSLIGAAWAQTTPAKTVLPVPPLPSLPSAHASIPAASPFTIVGFVQKATLNVAGNPLSGGTIQVNDHSISVSTNTSVNMPGTLLKWADLFKLAPAPWGPRQTGMALSDNPKPLTTYEVMVQGNRTISNGHDEYDAGLIFIWQQSANTGQGFISYIDYSTGELRVGGVFNDPSTGSRVRLNDPIGRFGRAMSPDVRFTVDEDNPTVRSTTGYPMCIPRVNVASASAANPVADDPLCPQINRPKDASGNFVRQIFMAPPPCSSFPLLPTGVPSAQPPACTSTPAADAPDATKQMPFEVGDYVTFQGSLEQDATSAKCITRRDTVTAPNPACEYISAWSVIATIGAFTAPGTMPAYVAIDFAQMGTGGIPNAGLPQEATANARVEGFTTDPTEPIDVFGVDIDACSGGSNDRYWGTQPVLQIAQLGKFRFVPIGGTFTPPVREVRAVSQTLSNGATPASISSARPFANDIIAGQYGAPITRFIFPEIGAAGLAPIPLNLQDFPYLAEGLAGTPCSAALTPSTLSFANQAPGTTSAPQTVTLTNSGTGTVNITNLSVSNGFTQTNNCGSQLTPGSSCTLNVSFQAGTTRVQVGMLEITDSASGGAQRVSLVGTVSLPAIASVTPSVLQFADQAPGTTSAPQFVTLSNSGGSDLLVSNVTSTAGYVQSNHCPATLKAGGSCTVGVSLRPTALGAQPGTLTIADSAQGSPRIISLNGVGTDFNVSSSRTVAMVNAGSTATFALNVTGTPLASGTVNFSCSGLPAGAHCRFSRTTLRLQGTRKQPVTVSITTSRSAGAGRLTRTSASSSSSQVQITAAGSNGATHNILLKLTITPSARLSAGACKSLRGCSGTHPTS